MRVQIAKAGIFRTVMRTRVRYSRGMSWLSDLKYIVGAAGLKLFLDNDVAVLALLVAATFGVAYSIGWLDEKKGIWKLEQCYYNQELNPFFKGMDERIKRIEKAVGANGK